MITEERKLRIMEIIRQDGFISIKQIMSMFNVSRSSAMRDLDELVSQGLVVRKRGGASLEESDLLLSQFNELPTKDKQYNQQEQKKRICKYASNLIKDGSTIYIDSGTTVLYLVDYIREREITIITPNTRLLTYIPSDFKGKIILLEGEYSPKYECVGGSITANSILKYHYDYAFLTANGIDFDTQEVCGTVFQFSENKNLVMSRSDHVELLIDYSKKNVKGISTWAHFDDFDHIYIDQCEDQELNNKIIVCE